MRLKALCRATASKVLGIQVRCYTFPGMLSDCSNDRQLVTVKHQEHTTRWSCACFEGENAFIMFVRPHGYTEGTKARCNSVTHSILT